MPRHYKRKKSVMVVRAVQDKDVRGRGAEKQIKAPPTLWRELWFDTTKDGDSLVMNAAIFRNDDGIVGEFYIFWNGERITQLDCRITDEQQREALEGLLVGKANVVLKRCGLPTVESRGWTDLRTKEQVI